MIKITETEVFSTDGKYVHRLNTDNYFKRATKLPNDTEALFEEVDNIPAPPTEEEIAFKSETEAKVRDMFFARSIPSAINTYGLTDKEALAVKDVFPEWQEGIEVKQGERYRDGGLLWRCLQGHTTQANWRPGLATASLWEVVDEEHAGTPDDPIPYTPPMQLELGKTYKEDGVLYTCIRSSGIPLNNSLKDLVGIYVEPLE